MGTLSSNQIELAVGLAEAAAELGSPHSVFRSTAVPLVNGSYAAPTGPAFLTGSVLASFTRNYKYSLQIDPLKPQRIAVVDPRLVQVGDYLVSGADIYYIGNMAPMQPIAAVKCNQRLTVSHDANFRVARPGTVGSQGQLGDVFTGPRDNTKPLLIDWPGSVLYSGRGGKPLSSLPTDDSAPQWTVLLPMLPVVLHNGDIISDDMGRQLVILSFEVNATGVRIIANQAQH